MSDPLALKLAELRRRRLKDQKFELSDFCFKEQLDFILDPAQFKTAVCSRRAGKTIACAADLINTAISNPDVVCLYITLRRNNAKRLVWPELKKINEQFALGGVVNESDLSMTFGNRAVIYCTGAKDKTEIENFRGLALKKVYIDECQSFRAYIEDLIDDVISKALFDYNGTLCLIGTPGMVPTGYFAECAGADKDHPEKAKAYRHHVWTMFNNPHLERKSGKKVQELVDADCSRMGVTIEHPKIRRECFGEWAIDRESLVFAYDRAKNDYQALPELPGAWEFVIGVDLGFEDSDAIAVIGWHSKRKETYLVEERVQPKQTISDLAAQISAMIDKYKPLKVVMDTGGLGKKIAEELTKRHRIPIQAAEKSRKIEFIELLNDAMKTARFFAKAGSAFAQDCFKVEWDFDKTTPDKKVISDVYHSDITDAVLYAFREALHWLYEAPALPAPKPGTQEWARKEEEKMEEIAEELNKVNNSVDFDDFSAFNSWDQSDFDSF